MVLLNKEAILNLSLFPQDDVLIGIGILHGKPILARVILAVSCLALWRLAQISGTEKLETSGKKAVRNFDCIVF